MKLRESEKNNRIFLIIIVCLFILMAIVSNIIAINSIATISTLTIVLFFYNGITIAIFYFFITPVLFIFNKKTKYLSIQEKALNEANQLVLRRISGMVSEYTKETTKEQEFKLLKNKAEFMELRSQINPHFLYNTLEAIRSEALEQGAPDVAKMTKTLSEFYRYSIGTYRELVSLREELRNIINYVKIQQYRFGDKFSLVILIDDEDSDCFNYQILKLTLQPIVENSIYHAFELSMEKGVLTISAVVTKKNLVITVSDNGCGIDDETLERINLSLLTEPSNQIQGIKKEDGSMHSGTGIALSNVNNRIKLYFGDDYGLVIHSTKNIGTDVEITLPIVPVHWPHQGNSHEK